MKNKLVMTFIFLIGLVTLCACSNVETNNSNISDINNPQKLNIFKSDLKLTQEQVLSQIKAEHLLENKGYLDDDELVVLVTLDTEALIDVYNNNYAESVNTVSEFAKTEMGKKQAKLINQEQTVLIDLLQEKNLIKRVEYQYSTIINAVAVKTTYANFLEINKMKEVKSTIISDTFNVPKAVDTDASAIVNDVDVYETGIYKSDCVDYTGKGTAVAILDSGFDCSHTVFQHDIDVEMITKSQVESILSQTRAATDYYRGNAGLKVTDVYYNAKIPFAYDYADRDYDVFPYDSNHGTHVAGIIGGKDSEITGIAVDTQLVLMKVFPDLDDGGKTEDILAALEDAVLLGVDAINMSLGSSCGFAREEDDDKLNEVYDSINASGISLITAASNSYSSSFGGEQGNTNFVTNPDSGTVGSPSTYDAALSVASISGTKSKYLIANNSKVVFFTESSSINGKENDFFKGIYESLGKSLDETLTLEYVTVPGVGKEVNFLSLDVEGKIALIRRGDNTFEEKAKNAKAHGAIACIIYNNIEGDISMSMGKSDHIPTISISKELGTALAKKDKGTFTISYNNQAGPFMSDFSSWGPTPSLGIKPEITAHGGNIKSSVPGGGYDQLSGTSMATPNLCGIVVLIRQYLKEEYPDKTMKEISVMANQLLMSTAGIVLNQEGNPYSPRKQGAGLASLYNAVNTKAYITVDGIDRSKLELLDDPNKTGVYEMNFNLVNLSTESLSYVVSLVGMTETVSSSDEEHVAEKSQILDSNFTVTVEGGTLNNKTVVVEAGQTCKIKVVYTLSEDNKTMIENTFPYGMYVEGFVKLEDINTPNADNKNINLNIPFLAFYGDWSQAPIFDKTYYEVESEAHDASIDAEDKLKADYFATTPYGSYYYNYIIPLGTYLYDIDLSKYDPIPATEEHIAISNMLGTIDGLSSVYAGLLRNCKTMTFTITDKQTGEVVYELTDYNAQKAYYNGMPFPYYEFLNQKSLKLGLVNNHQYEFKMEGKLDYKNDGTSTNVRNSFTFDFYMDDEAPILKDVEYTKEYDKTLKKDRYYITMTVYDNHYVQSITPIIFTSSSSYTFLTDNPIPVYSEFGQDNKVKFEITDYLDDIYTDSIITNGLAFSIDDYALNSDIYICQLPGTEGEFKFTKDGTMEGTELIILSMYENEAIDLTKYLATKDETVDESKDYLKYLTWTSSNEDVVQVKDGIVKGLKPGRATITALENLYGNKAILILNVKEKVDDQQSTNSDTIKAEDFNNAKIEDIRFSYFDTIFAYSRAAQTSEIGSTGSRIYVSSLPGGVSMYPGEQIQLAYDLDPWYVEDNYKLKFTSKNPSVAKVDPETGAVTALKKGTTTIVLSVEGSNLMASIKVTVKSEFVIENRVLIAYKGLGGDVVIPDDEGILYIGSYAFCLYETDNSIELSEDDYDANKIPAMNTTIKSVVIPEGVEEIQKFAFYNCLGLEKVELPSSMKIIREYAFCGDEDLQSINLSRIETIGREAFRDCVNLTLNEKDLTKAYALGAKAFEGCEKLTSLDLTALRNAGQEIFKNCINLESVILNESTKLSYGMFVGSGLKEVDIYEKVSIPEFCFALCKSLTKVNIHNSLVSIDKGAFSECISLNQMNILGNVDYIGEQVFYGDNALESIKLPNNNVTLGGYCFLECTNLETIEFQENTYIDKIEGSIFEDTNLKTFIVNDNNRYYETNSDGSLLVSDDETTIIFGATGKDFGDLVIDAKYQEIGSAAFSGAKIKSLTITNNETIIHDFAFANCEELETITLPTESGIEIKQHAFNYAKGLTKVNNLEYVKLVGDYAFANTGLREVTIGSDATYGEGAFFKSYLETVTIGKNTTFGLGAFQDCLNLVTVNMPTEGNVHFGRGCFAYDDKLKTIDLSKVDSVIEPETFYGCKSLYSVNLANVKEIGDYAFSDCSGIITIEMPVVETIGMGAFSRYETYGGAPLITSITLPETLKEIGDGAFLGCERLESVVIPNSVTKWGDYVFAYCLLLESVELPETLTTVGLYSFAGCESLENINLNYVTEIKDYAFTSCTYLTSINIDSIVTIGEAAFADTALIGTFNLNNLESVGNFAFQGSKISSINATKLKTIGEAAFQNCDKLQEFIFSDQLESIEILAFNGCSSLSSFYVYVDGVKKNTATINDYAFLNNGNLYTYMSNGKIQLTAVPQASNILELNVLEGTSRIEVYAGNENPNINNIILPDSLETIGSYAFYGFTNLKSVEFKSFQAPILESFYNQNAALEETDPGYDLLHNQYGLFGLELYYYNFVDLVGKIEPLEMILPVNDNITGYDSLVYLAYFGSVEDATKGNHLAKETNLITFVELAKKIKELDQVLIQHEDMVNEALTALKAIKLDYSLFNISEEEWNFLVETVETAKETIQEIKIKNSKKQIKDVYELLKTLPTSYNSSIDSLLIEITNKLNELTLDDRSVLDLANYNKLYEEYEKSNVENEEPNEPNVPQTPQQPVNPEQPKSYVWLYIVIGSVVLLGAGILVYFLVIKKRKGGN